MYCCRFRIILLFFAVIIAVTSFSQTNKFVNISSIGSSSSSDRLAGPVFADFNGDGFNDILVRNDLLNLRLYLNNPANPGVFSNTYTSIIATMTGSGSVDASDFNNDGSPDFVASDGKVYLNNGSGSFTAMSGVLLKHSVATPIGVIKVLDVNNDGKKDVIWFHQGNISTNFNEVWLNTGSSSAPNFTYYSGFSNSLTTSSSIDFADIDGDGDLDVVGGAYSFNAEVWKNDGSGNFTSAQTVPSYSNYVKFNDWNRDGKVDLLVFDRYNAYGLRVCINDGVGGFANPVIIKNNTVTVGSHLNLDDINGDGLIDGFLGTTLAGSDGAEVWINNGCGMLEQGPGYVVGISWYGVYASDLTGDGKKDLVSFARDQPSTIWKNDLSLQKSLSVPGNGLDFTGSNYVSAPDVNVNISTGDLTLEAWVLLNGSQQNYAGIVSKAKGSGVINGFQLITYENKLAMEFTAGSVSVGLGVAQGLVGTTSLNDGRWHHVAAVVDRSSSRIKLYVDGNVEANVVNGNIATYDVFTTDSLLIGLDRTRTKFFKGKVDEVRIWNNARTDSEIATNKSASLSPCTFSSNLWAYYKFDNGTAASNNADYYAVLDLSSYANNGFLRGFGLNGSTSNWVESYALVAPTGNAASSITTTGFTANWSAPSIGSVSNYRLDVSTDTAFGSFLSGYQALSVSGLSWVISGLSPGVKYFYRVRAEKTGLGDIGANSNIITTSTVAAPATSVTNLTVCDSITWNSTLYTTTGVYSKTFTGGSSTGADSIATLNLIVHSSPAIPTISNNRPLTFCSGDSTVLSSSAATGNQWLLNGSNVVGATGQTLVVKTGGSYTVMNTNGSGCSATSIGTAVVVNSLPVVPTISNNRPLTFCSGDSTVLSSSAATGNQWVLNGSNVVGATGQTLVVKTSGSYSVVNTNANGCSATSTATTVVVNSLPAAPTISNNRPLTFCSGDSTVLSSSASSGNQWVLNGSNVVGATGQTLVVKTAGSYTVVNTNASSCSATSSATTVVVNSLPATPTISNNRPLTFCTGDSTVLSSSAATGNQWLLNGSNVVGATGQTLVVKTSGSYTVINTNASGCSATSSATTVVVNSLPATPTISNNRPLTFCTGDSTVLSSSAATGNQWLLNGSNVVGATGQSLVVKTSGLYTVINTNASGCSATSSATTVVVNSLPATPTISNNRPLTFCVGDSTVLSSSAATGNQWVLNGSNVAGATGQTLVVKSGGSYTVSVTNANGCSSVSSATTVVVNSLPAVPTIGNNRPLTFCTGDSTVLSSSAATGNQWLLNGSNVVGATGQTLVVKTSGAYTVANTNASGCSATSTATTVVVNSFPATPTISNNRPLTFCVGDSTVLSSSAATGNQWLLNGNNVVGATGQTLVVKAAGVYTVAVTNAGGCRSVSAGTTIVVNSLPTTPTISNNRPLTFCVGDSTVLSSSAATGNQWFLNGSNVVGATGQTLVVKTAGSYTIINTNVSGCSATSSAITVVVNSFPATPTISNNRSLTFCTGDSTVLSSSAATGNQWLLNGNNVVGATGQTLAVKTAGVYTVAVTNAGGCRSVSSGTTVVVNSLPAVPTISNNRPLIFCSGDSTVLSSSAATGNQWLLNGSNVVGATGQTLVVKTSGSYTVRVTNANGCFVSSGTVNTINNSTAGAGLAFRDSLICKATSLRVTAQAVSPTAFLWTGVRTGFSASTQSVNISNADMYRVRITLSNGCVVNDSINLRNTADTAIKARIAMTKQAFVNQQVLAVNITSVKPQTQNWVFSSGSTVISQNDSVALLRFATVGNYQVILNNTSYNVCKSADTARIVITTNDYPSTTTPPAIIIRNITIGPNPTTGISNVTIDLNKPGNVTMRIFNFNGTQIYTRAITNTTATTIRERIDISNQPSNNTYILVVQCEGSYEVRSILKN